MSDKPKEYELDWITTKGFRSIGALERLELRALNVLIGPNGSGKSNFIGVFAFLHSIREGRLAEYVAKAGGADNILHFGSKTTPTLTIEISFRRGVNGYKIALEPTDADGLLPVEESAHFWDGIHPGPFDKRLPRNGLEAGISDPMLPNVGRWVRERLGRWRLYHFHDTSSSSPLKKTCDLNDNAFLRSDGSNLAAFLYYLRQKHMQSYLMIRATVQRVTPFFDDFHLEPNRLNPDKIRLEWRHKKSDKYFDASSLSDGTLRFMALATLLLQPVEYRPSVVLIDEPELGLHPYAITMLASTIRSAADGTQIIVSTQSPMLLDHFGPEDVLVADRADGGTKLSRLEPGRWNSWLEDYSLGQLWEKNEFGGRPSGG